MIASLPGEVSLPGPRPLLHTQPPVDHPLDNRLLSRGRLGGSPYQRAGVSSSKRTA